MNTKNNRRRKESQGKIEKSFVNMLLVKSINKISVTDICKETGLNRTTFYANYTDIYDLANKIRGNIEKYFNDIFSKQENRTVLNFFQVIYDNRIMFKVYFKLPCNTEQENIFYINKHEEKFFKREYVKYHTVFFKNGLNAMLKLWLDNDCRETPEEMANIIKTEYEGRNESFSS